MTHFSVVTLQFGDLPYFRYSTEINSRYCERHDLEFSVHGPLQLNDRHPVWSKVELLIETLEHSELALFLDADAVFLNHERDVSHLIRLLGKRAVLFSLDRAHQANTGLILARRGYQASAVLGAWSRVPNYDREHAFKWPLEQGALGKHILGRYQSEIALPSRLELDTVSGTYVKHFAALPAGAKAQLIHEEHTRLAKSYGW